MNSLLKAAKDAGIPIPRVMRRVWIPGIQYEGETTEQMIERERICAAEDARADSEIERLVAWKLRPWWA
jgi:hypothetical protein